MGTPGDREACLVAGEMELESSAFSVTDAEHFISPLLRRNQKGNQREKEAGNYEAKKLSERPHRREFKSGREWRDREAVKNHFGVLRMWNCAGRRERDVR
jgi:hypothetical protein